MALSSVNSGPPNSPACWPVMTTRVAGSASRAADSRDAAGALRAACCAAMTRAISAGCRVKLCERVMVSAHAAGVAGSPAKNGATFANANA